MKRRIDIDELYFGVVMHPLSYSSDEERTSLNTYNLFRFTNVKWSVARYVTMSKEEKRALINPLAFCFGDVWGRTEFEFMACPWPFRDNETIGGVGQKVSLYDIYVVPNAKLLMDMVEMVSVSSARKYLIKKRKNIC